MRAGREVFLPMIEQRIRIHKRSRIREYPLFPSYIFVRMCLAVTSILERWNSRDSWDRIILPLG